jgi:hypothetical protein
VSGIGDQAEPGQFVLVLPLRLIVAREERRAVIVGVVVEVVDGDKEGALLGLDLLDVYLLECLLVESSLLLVLAGGVLVLVLVLAGVVLAKGVLVLLGAVGDEVVGVSIAITSFLQTTALEIQAVVVKSREPADD